MSLEKNQIKIIGLGLLLLVFLITGLGLKTQASVSLYGLRIIDSELLLNFLNMIWVK